MEGKVAVTLIVFLFPALIVPLFLISYLTKVPGPLGTFFTNYSMVLLWGTYLLLAICGFFLFRYFQRLTARQALAAAKASEIAAEDDESEGDDEEANALIVESQQE